MPDVSLGEYARLRGVPDSAVHALVLDGKIKIRRDGRKRMIDSDAADMAMGVSRADRAGLDAAKDAAIGAGPVPAGEAPELPPVYGLTKARTETETYRARMAALEYEQAIGKLVPVEAVTASMQRCAELLVRDLERIPMAADELAAAFRVDGLPGLRVALKKIVAGLRTTIADNMRVNAGDRD